MTIRTINYPEKYKPENSHVYVKNEILIQASAKDIWYWLTNATTWPDWYANASNVQILNQTEGHLKAGTQFKWKTFGFNIKSEVVEYKPFQSLAWEAVGTGLQAYHAWLIVPTEDGYKIITEETQKRWLSRLGKLFMPNQMYQQHQIWLEGLKMKAENK